MAGGRTEDELRIECVDRASPAGLSRRIVVDVARRELLFVNCLWPRRFLASGFDGEARCRFEDVLSAREFGAGTLRRLYIGTRGGRCAISPEWEEYEELRAVLQQISAVTQAAAWSDDPRILLPLTLVVVFGIVGTAIYFLL